MIEYLSTNQGTFWMIVGFVLLIVEVLVLGLGTNVLLFPAFGALATGGLLWSGLLPPGWLFGIASFGVCSALITAILWQPLKRLQAGPRHHRETSSDFIGLRFHLEQPLARDSPGTHRYSGITWRVELDSASAAHSLPAGAKVEVSGLDAGVLRVVQHLPDAQHA